MNRRSLLSAGPAAMALAGAAVSPAAAAASSPVLDAARQIAALNLQHEQADVPGADGAALDRIWGQVWPLEGFILAAAPATITEAMVILMVAVGSLDRAAASDGVGAITNAAMDAASRASRYLAGAAGVSVADFGGDLYLPACPEPACMGRAA